MQEIDDLICSNWHMLVNNERDCGLIYFQTSSLSSNSRILKNNSIDLGFIAFKSLPLSIPAPLGYEDDDNDKDNRKLVIDNIEIAFIANNDMNIKNSEITIDDYYIYPKNHRDVMSVYDSNDNDIKGLTITNTDPTKINLEFIFKYNKEPQFIGCYLVFKLKYHQIIDAITITKTTTLIGLRIRGTLGLENIEKRLNVESRPFIPIENLKYFDHELPTYLSQTRLEDEDLGINSPPKWQNIYSRFGLRSNLPIGYTYLHDVPFDLISEYNQLMLNINNRRELSKLLDYYLVNVPPRMRMKHPRDMISNYISVLRICSWFEESQTFLDIARLDDVSIKIEFSPITFKNCNGYALLQSTIKKKGSNESRPKITAGDHIRIRPTVQSLKDTMMSQERGFEIVGNIKSYNLKTEEYICVFVIPAFVAKPPYEEESLYEYSKFLSSLSYNVRYTSDNIGFIIQRRSLDMIINDDNLQRLLFPKASLRVDITADYIKVQPNNEKTFNEEQSYAIETISLLADSNNYVCSSSIDNNPLSAQPDRLCPWIIYGPPGTGKTSTLVASINQIYNHYGSSKRILVTAPSDAAADVLCKRLIKVFDPSQMIRLNYWKRLDTSVPIEIRRYCYFYNESNLLELPEISVLNSFNIIVTTCVTSGVLDLLGIKFDVVMIDEASQASEVDCLVPLMLTTPTSLVVLAGDPEQLRATNRSPIFNLISRNESLQERLLKSSVYSSVIEQAKKKNFATLFGSTMEERSNDMSCRLGVFLTKNYRSHQSLFELSSRLFYHSSLEEYGDKQQISRLLDVELLPNKKMGALFFGVLGQHSHELDSPSFYNVSELSKVVEVCRNLLSSSTVQISTKDIGIICAFRSQILKLRLLLRQEGMGNINVGDVFDFQGQEVSIIIISTVLSTKTGLKNYEQDGKLGLQSDHRKFNVSITRGSCLCIVIGNPYMLNTDEWWKQYIEYCDSNGSYIGDKLTNDNDNNVIASLLGDVKEPKVSVLGDYYSDMPFYSMM